MCSAYQYPSRVNKARHVVKRVYTKATLIDKKNAIFTVINYSQRIWRIFNLAEWTGLEPATPGVTGRYSNQLNYHSISWWVLQGSNLRPSPCKGDALPAELSTR